MEMPLRQQEKRLSDREHLQLAAVGYTNWSNWLLSLAQKGTLAAKLPLLQHVFDTLILLLQLRLLS
eukprot:1244203-Pyramimonas_sp.AAC.1